MWLMIVRLVLVSVAIVPVLVTVVGDLVSGGLVVVASVIVLLVVTAVGWLGLVRLVPRGLGDGADESDDQREGELGPTVATHLSSVVERDHGGVGGRLGRRGTPPLSGRGAAKPRGEFDGRPHGVHAREIGGEWGKMA